MALAEAEKKPRRRVKKVKGHAGHHGGAWKVAYADFVTAMMALFLVLWLVSQADTKLKQSIASYFRSPGVFDQVKGGIVEGPKKVSKEPSPLTSKDEEQALFGLSTLLRKKFSTQPTFSKYKDQIRIEMTEQGLRIQILDKAERVSFSSGSAELTPEASAILHEIAQAICQLPNPLLIGGHTDRHLFPPNSQYTNWELSADRANAARRSLEESCVQSQQIQRIVGYADTELLVPEDPYAMANRRISITVMRMFPTSSPTTVTKSEDEVSSETQRALTGDSRESAPEGKPSQAVIPSPAGPTSESTKKLRSVLVGEPDKVPADVQHTKEPASPAAGDRGH